MPKSPHSRAGALRKVPARDLAAVPRLPAKLNLLILVRQFESHAAAAEAAAASLSAAAEQVERSPTRAAAAAALAAGNELNAGRRAAAPRGWRLESLLKLADVKATAMVAGDSRGAGGAPAARNLLEFVAWLVSSRSPPLPPPPGSGSRAGATGLLCDELPALRALSSPGAEAR